MTVPSNYKGNTSYGNRSEDVLSEQVPKEHGAMNNGEQVNDHIEEDDHIDNIVEDDGINTLIHDTFNVRMDGHDDDHENHYKNLPQNLTPCMSEIRHLSVAFSIHTFFFCHWWRNVGSSTLY